MASQDWLLPLPPPNIPLRFVELATGDYAVSVAKEFVDSAVNDAFGRLRVSNPTSLFNSQHQYDTSPLLWETVTAGSGSITHLPNESTVRMDVTTASGDSVVRQQRGYNRYQPGRSQFILVTFVMDTPQENLYQYVGYADAQNGLLVETVDTTVYVTLRSYVSGAVFNGRVAQEDWNIDPMDGTGPSGAILDITTRQIFAVDLEWLGVGRVRVGFNIDGATHYVHEFDHANIGTEVYMTTANLPLLYGIEALDTLASAASLKHICGNVDSEGGYQDDFGFPFAASNAATTINVSTRRPILSIRPKLTFNSIANRATLVPTDFSAYVASYPCYVEVVYGGTLTNASFASVNAASVVDYDVAATAITGGIPIWGGLIPVSGANVNQSKGGGAGSLTSKLPLTLNRAGAHPTTPYTDSLSIVVTGIGGTAAVSGSLMWKELR